LALFPELKEHLSEVQVSSKDEVKSAAETICSVSERCTDLIYRIHKYYPKVDGRVRITEMVTLEKNCAKLQNEVQENYTFCFDEVSIPFVEKKLYFQQTFTESCFPTTFFVKP
jgi:hypothetical protein